MTDRPVPVQIVAFPSRRTMEQNRAREATLITAVLSAVCGLARLCGMLPALDRVVSSFFLAVLLLAAVVVLLRWLGHRVRMHFEDRDDARAAEHWRQTHARRASTTAGSEQRSRPMRAA